MHTSSRDNSPLKRTTPPKESASTSAGYSPKPVNILEELPELQKLIVLAQVHTNALSEAKTACLEHDYAEAQRLVGGAREQYYQKFRKHLGKEPETRGLSKADAQKLLARHRQIEDVLARFDRILPLLEKLAESKLAGRPEANRATETSTTVRLPENLRQEIEAAQEADAKFEVVQKYFNAAPVQTSRQIRDGSFYSLVHQGEVVLLLCTSNDAGSDAVGMAMAFTGRDVKPILRRKLLELGQQNKLHQLDLKGFKAASQAETAVADNSQTSDDIKIRTINELFASLIPAAKASGLPVNIDAIVFVREHDLPLQRYRAAFNTINGLCLNLEAAADQLVQQIKRDEQDHAAGVLKMSVLEWQRKKQRDTEQATKVNSTLRYFRLALDQLNVLVTPDD